MEQGAWPRSASGRGMGLWVASGRGLEQGAWPQGASGWGVGLCVASGQGLVCGHGHGVPQSRAWGMGVATGCLRAGHGALGCLRAGHGAGGVAMKCLRAGLGKDF